MDKKILFVFTFTIFIIISIVAVLLRGVQPEGDSTVMKNDTKLSTSSTSGFNVPSSSPSASPTATPTKKPIKQYSEPPPMTIDPKKSYTAVMQTSKGAIVFELFADETPIAVNNFVSLSRSGFYDGTKFHRIIKDFMIQGGDPKGDGTGGPGYKFNDEPITRDYTRGIIAMANSGPNTNGSQFFIMHADYNLPKQYVIFGQVTKGFEVVDTIANIPVKSSAMGESSVPTEDVLVESINIEEK